MGGLCGRIRDGNVREIVLGDGVDCPCIHAEGESDNCDTANDVRDKIGFAGAEEGGGLAVIAVIVRGTGE